MRSRQPVVRTLAGLATLFVPACSVSPRPAPQQPLAVTAAAPAARSLTQPEEAEAGSEVVPAASEPAAAVSPGTPTQTANLPLPAAAAQPPAQNQEVEVLQSEIRRLSQREAASREALDTLKTMMQARAARPQVTYLGNATTGAFTPPAPAVHASLSPPDDAETARDRAKLQKDLRHLESQLASERQQRQELEAQLKQLREETAVGPYADSMSDELVAARRKVEGLEAALTSAQRARDDLATKYGDLKAKRDSNHEQDADTQAQIAVLEQRQREALQGLEQELAASQAREHELRQTVTESEKTDGEVSYALVGDLRAENAALKAKLQEAHSQNAALTGKLKAASRVADMIFKDRVPNEDDSY